MSTFRKKAVDHKFIISSGYSAEFYGWTAKTAETGTAIRHIPYTFHILILGDEIQKPSYYLFWFSIGSYVMDQESKGLNWRWKM